METHVAEQTFKNASIFTEGKKHGNAGKATLDMESGGEEYVGDDGYLGSTNGKQTSKLSFTDYVPTGGKPEQDIILRAFLTNKRVKFDMGPIGSKVFKFPSMKITKLKLETDMAKGTLSMDVDMTGGKPTLV